MPRNCYTVEQIITKLREAEVALSKGQPVVQVPWPSGSPNKPTIAGNSGIGFSSLKRSMSVFVSAGSTALRKAKPTAQRQARASGLAFGKEVTLQTFGKDRYKRTLGDVILPDGMHINQELVKQGWCWWYRKYAPWNTTLEGLETEAREARKGLWVDPQPVPALTVERISLRCDQDVQVLAGRQRQCVGFCADGPLGCCWGADAFWSGFV